MKYRALRTIKNIYRLAGMLSLLGLLYGLITIFSNSFFSGISIMIISLLAAISFYAISEGIEVIIDIADNTNRAVRAFEASSKVIT